MRVLIFAVLTVAAVSCGTILRTGKLPSKPAVWCEPDSTYSASADDVFGGGTCYCSNDGSIAHCHTVYSGANFSFTQSWKEKRGNLGMCLPDGTCFKVPLKRDLPNPECQPLVVPSLCTAKQDGRTYNFIMGLDDDVVDGTVNINGITYDILPYVMNGQRRVYL